MPHTSSAKKRLRQNVKRRLRNRNVKKEIKTHVKAVLTAGAETSGDQLRDAVRLAVKKLDQAAAKGVVHRNLVARKKSQLAKLLNKTKVAAQGSQK